MGKDGHEGNGDDLSKQRQEEIAKEAEAAQKRWDEQRGD